MNDTDIGVWEAIGPDIGYEHGPPSYGLFEGERGVVVDYVDLLYPGFKKGFHNKHGASLLKKITWKPVTPSMVVKLSKAIDAKKRAEALLKEALSQ